MRGFRAFLKWFMLYSCLTWSAEGARRFSCMWQSQLPEVEY